MVETEKQISSEFGWLNSSSRYQSAKKNIMVSVLAQPLLLILTFGVRTVFIKTLGEEYLGLNGLYTNLLSFLSFAELGIGIAISAALYEPIAARNTKAINVLMIFFRKIYRIIAGIVFVGGIILTVALPYFINGTMPQFARIGFILFFMNSVVSYLLVTNRTLLAADQKQYINVLNQFAFSMVQQIVQVLILIYLHNFLLYLAIQIMCTLISNIWISIIVRKNYPFLNYNISEKISPKVLSKLKSNVLGMVSAKFGGIILTGTDNIILSSFIGLTIVGQYSNYMLIINGCVLVLSAILGGITATIGNLKSEKNKIIETQYFNNFFDLNALLISIISMGLTIFLIPFIKIWAGPDYILSWVISGLIVMTFFTNQLRQIGISYIVAYELFGRLKIKSIIEAGTNLIVSLLLVVVFKLGIMGVLIGTLLSNIVINYYWESKIVMSDALHASTKKQTVKMYLYTLGSAIVLFSLSYVSYVINSSFTYWITWILDLIIFMIMSFLVISVHLYKNKELRQLFFNKLLRRA